MKTTYKAETRVQHFFLLFHAYKSFSITENYIRYLITWFFPKISGESVKITSDDVMDADDGVDEACIDYVFAPAGLYPLPMPRNTK